MIEVGDIVYSKEYNLIGYVIKREKDKIDVKISIKWIKDEIFKGLSKHKIAEINYQYYLVGQLFPQYKIQIIPNVKR